MLGNRNAMDLYDLHCDDDRDRKSRKRERD